MNGTEFLNKPGLYLEIGQHSLRALDGEDGLELPLERLENGRLTALCAEKLALGLRDFVKKHKWRPHGLAYCALGARGVSLRRLNVPASPKDELEKLLPLQIEREFPLAPHELAWGYRRISPASPPGNGAPAVQELLVAAVRKEVLQEYADLLSQCGLTPVFTLAALVRNSLCSQPPKAYAVLDIGRNQSELTSFDNNAPSSIRVLPWGGESLTNALEKNLAVSHAEAERLKLHLDERQLSNGELEEKIQSVLRSECHSLARSLQPNWLGQRLYLSGGSACLKDLAPQLAKAIGSRTECVSLPAVSGEGRSTAILGLKRSCERNGASPLLVLQLAPSDVRSSTQPSVWKWVGLMGLLLLGSISLRYAEPLFQKPRLAKRISEIKAYRETLPKIERELSFLQYLKTNQPPYLDCLAALASAAPSGARIESLSLSARGDLSLRGSMRDSQQVADFRSKLIESGLFSSVVVEEQTPTPDRQKLVVRMTGQWKAIRK